MSLKNSKSKLIDYLTPELCKRLQKCIDIKSINAFQSNIDMEPVSGNKSENDKSNENDFQYHEKVCMYNYCKRRIQAEQRFYS